jgi:hypothetical protein
MVRKSLVAAPAVLLLLLAFAPQVGTANSTTEAVNAQENSKSTQVFTGTIVESGEKYLLDDPTNKVTYELDDPKKASAFVGKKVRVVGSLDATMKILHVESLQEVT